jgi:hypothetical protein
MSRITFLVLVILTVALAAWAGNTGLGTDPYSSGDELTATAINTFNNQINDNDSRIDVIEAINGIVVCDGAGNCTAAVAGTDYQGVPAEGAFADGDKTKLDGIESGADDIATASEGEYANSTVTGADIKDGEVDTDDLANNAVTAAKMDDTQDWSGKDITLPPPPTLTIELDDLSDTTTPHNIVENETRGFIISNGNASADAVLDFEDSALAEGRDFCVVIEAAYQVTIEPDTGENWYLNGTQCGADDAIFNDDDTVGEMVCCFSTERNMFCVSQDANWECE